MLRRFEIEFTVESKDEEGNTIVSNRVTTIDDARISKAWDRFVEWANIFNSQIPQSEIILVNENVRVRQIGKFEIGDNFSKEFIPEESI